MHATFRSSIAFRWDATSKRFEPAACDELQWSIFDQGTVFGAIVVERMRTYGGALVNWPLHYERLKRGVDALDIEFDSLSTLVLEQIKVMLAANHSLIEQEQDVGVVILMSPGRSDTSPSDHSPSPTLMMHINPLPWRQLASWYKMGTSLHLSPYCTVPSSCWPSDIKTRSRLPYLLSQPSRYKLPADSLAVLQTLEGKVSDTSVANLLMVNGEGKIYSPDRHEMLPGCTLRSLFDLAVEQQLSIEYKSITPDELSNASELILTGSTGGVWHACSFNGELIGDGQPGPLANRLMAMWRNHVGIDYRQQAIQRASM
jgi:branched-subunit amino acid aminotransferase/4-amino-4-deoxychorismate lyase